MAMKTKDTTLERLPYFVLVLAEEAAGDERVIAWHGSEAEAIAECESFMLTHPEGRAQILNAKCLRAWGPNSLKI